MCGASCQPTTIRLKQSITNAKKTSPSQQRRWDRSATQSWFGRDALKSRWTRSGRRCACRPGLVVRQGLPRRFAPRIPFARISRCTRQRGACSPARRSAFHIRR
jgi:hypothetical protein